MKTTYSVYFEVPQVLHLLQAGQAYPVQTYMHNIVIVYMYSSKESYSPHYGSKKAEDSVHC